MRVLASTAKSADDQQRRHTAQGGAKFHPDKNPGDKDAGRKVRHKEAAGAQMLSNPDKKARYDQLRP